MIDGRADNEALGWQPFSQPMGGGSDCDGDLCDLAVAPSSSAHKIRKAGRGSADPDSKRCDPRQKR